VNPWSRAEAGGESVERDLFARRARALEPAVVPSLAAVLREAAARREARAVVSARGRSFVAMALAAACLMAALTKVPRPETLSGTREPIAAERDASAGSEAAPVIASSAQEPAAGDTCSMEDQRLALEEEQACFTPAPLYTPAPAFAGTQASRTCDSNESCAIPTQSQ
jgi:hypothetical protein